MSEGFQDSPKQREIMRLILEAADRGAFITLRDLHASLTYGPEVSVQAIQCSARFLERHGMLERARQGRERIYKPTMKAYTRYRGSR